MKSETLNIILVGIIIYLLMQKNKNDVSDLQKLKYAEAVGMAKAVNGDLGTTF